MVDNLCCQARKAENTDPPHELCGKICYSSWRPNFNSFCVFCKLKSTPISQAFDLSSGPLANLYARKALPWKPRPILPDMLPDVV